MPPARAQNGRQAQIQGRDLRHFDLFSMKPFTCTLAVGMRGSGKSVVMANVLYALTGRDRDDKYRRIPKVYIFSNTENETGFYSQWMDCPDFIKDTPTPEMLQEIIDVQRSLFPKNVSPEERERIKSREALCLVFDDLSFDPEIFKSKPMRWLLMNGRHVGFCCIFGVQFCMDLPAGIRGQIDYVFAMAEPVIKSRQRLYDQFFGVFPTVREFHEVFLNCTKNYRAMVLDKSVKDCDPFKMCFWFKATVTEKLHFKAGGRDFQRFIRYRKRQREAEAELEREKAKRACHDS